MTISGEHDGSIAAILSQLRYTAGLEGVAVLDLSQVETPISYTVGMHGLDTIELGRSLMKASPLGPSHSIGADRRPVLACPWVLPPSRPGGLVMWRTPRGNPWTEGDHGLAATVAALLLIVFKEGIGQPGVDRLTGIPNRRWFIDEAERHIDRLDLDRAVGTLTLIDVDDLHRLNTAHGPGAGDHVLVRLANQLRSIVRPSDLVARVGADEFAIWQDGVDHLTAAERAETLCSRDLCEDMPNATGITVSIGIASRRPGGNEDIRTLLRRAHMTAREIKTQGGGGWRVSRP